MQLRPLAPLFCSLLFTFNAGANCASALAETKTLQPDDIDGLASLAPFEKKLNGEAAARIRYYEFNYAPSSVKNISGAGSGKARISLVAQTDAGMKNTHLQPFMTFEKGITTSSCARAKKALAAVNGGYFNLSNGVSASFVLLHGTVAASPRDNDALTGNPRLKKFLPQIFNRSELRVLNYANAKTTGRFDYSYQICAADARLPEGQIALDILQGGPRLLPDLTAENEAFLRHEPDGSVSDSIGVKRTAARTAVGITKEGRVLIVCVAGPKQDEFSSGVDLATLAALLKKLGCAEALNFDGGTSTTLIVRGLVTGDRGMALAPDQKKIDSDYCMMVGREPETLVKSTLCLMSD